MKSRGKCGRYSSEKKRKSKKIKPVNVILEHNYASILSLCDCANNKCPIYAHRQKGTASWQEGRRIVEFDVLLRQLECCQFCRLGPIPLTSHNVVGELKKGLSGYLYVVCQNDECRATNTVPYGKTHHTKTTGMPCFDVNTKLGIAMIDSLGGPVKVNNFLSSLNLPLIGNKNLKQMEERAGKLVMSVAESSTTQAAHEAYQKEMSDIAEQESIVSQKLLEDAGGDPDLGIWLPSDASPLVRKQYELMKENDDNWTDIDEVCTDDNVPSTSGLPAPMKSARQGYDKRRTDLGKCKTKLTNRLPCRTRTGMSCAVDTAWQKRGFDSLTSHTFFMSKSKYGKKVMKTIVRHRTCGVCNWWRRKRPGQTVRKHHCVRNHSGSSRLMESISGVQGVKELKDDGIPVEYLEGDGDNTMISRIKTDLNINMKKRFDRNHIVKNVGKSLYALHHDKSVKLSKIVIIHIEKCLKYSFAKNQGDRAGMEENLKSLIPHQFGDHSLCKGRFCGYKRKPGEVYLHRSLPYKAPLKDSTLREKLDHILAPLIANVDQLIDLGSSQQCEHANREVTLRAPKSLHYGNSAALDYRVHATAAFINDGRHYIEKTNTVGGLSPGTFTVKYADKCRKRRLQNQEKTQLPSTKCRRLILKQERATTQGAHEALEGVTYQSGVGHSADPDVEKIPDAVSRGKFKPINVVKPSFVTFDLETTDLIRGGQMPHITQIAAMNMTTETVFEEYVTPRIPISLEAQRVTGICVNGEGQMSVHGKNVVSCSIKDAISNLCAWLQSIPHAILIAHNGRRFDFPVLMSCLNSIGSVTMFHACVEGMLDSMSLFRKRFPNLSLKQENLAAQLLGISYNAHNATDDIRSLSLLVQYLNLPDSEILKYSFTPVDVLKSLFFCREKAKNLPSLHPLVSSGVCKMPTAENIAGSGLNLNHLKLICRRSGEDGLRNVFTAPTSDRSPRVTSVKKVLEEVIPKLAVFLQNK